VRSGSSSQVQWHDLAIHDAEDADLVARPGGSVGPAGDAATRPGRS